MVRVTVSPSPQAIEERQGDTPLPTVVTIETTRRYSWAPYVVIVVIVVTLVVASLVLGYAVLLAEPPSPSRSNLPIRLSHVLTTLLRTMATTLTVICTMLLALFLAAPMVYFGLNESTRARPPR
jgi:hypothetical protein